MHLADLVDLEWLLRDGGEVGASGTGRRRHIGRAVARVHGLDPEAMRARLDADRGLREELALAWLGAVREEEGDLPGARIAHGLELARWVLVGTGLLLGGFTARALLAYDGSVPVNVLYFAAFFFGLQILLLLAMLWFAWRARRAGRGGGPGVLHRPFALLAGRLLGKTGRGAAATLRAMGARRALYADVERWTLFALVQWFGVAFNAGALVVALVLIAFSDLVFSWSTTLELDAGAVHAAVRTLALPWSWWPEGVPDLEVVEASQWIRMQGTFVGDRPLADAIGLSARWWRFLIAGLVTWGLLPRLLALVGGSLRARRALRRAGLDHVGYQRLFDRLLPPGAGWEGPAAAEVRGEAPRRGRAGTGPAPSPPGAPAWIVVWGSLAPHADAVTERVRRRFGADVRAVHRAGGADLEQDRRTLAALTEAGASRVVVVAAAGQQPTRDVLDFLRGVRAAVGTARPVLVGLLDVDDTGRGVDATAAEREAWRRSLAGLDDPHLWVGEMEVPA